MSDQPPVEDEDLPADADDLDGLPDAPASPDGD